MDTLLTDDDLRGLLVIGAYRDGEVDAAHPLTVMVRRWGRLGVAPAQLQLQQPRPAGRRRPAR